MSVVDSKLKTILNRNKLSSDNTLNEIIEAKNEGNNGLKASEASAESSINFNASLSMNFGMICSLLSSLNLSWDVTGSIYLIIELF